MTTTQTLRPGDFRHSSVRTVAVLASIVPDCKVRWRDNCAYISHADLTNEIVIGRNGSLRDGKFKSSIRALLRVAPPGWQFDPSVVGVAAGSSKNDLRILESIANDYDHLQVIEPEPEPEPEPESEPGQEPTTITTRSGRQYPPDAVVSRRVARRADGTKSEVADEITLGSGERTFECNHIDCDYRNESLLSISSHRRIHVLASQQGAKFFDDVEDDGQLIPHFSELPPDLAEFIDAFRDAKPEDQVAFLAVAFSPTQAMSDRIAELELQLESQTERANQLESDMRTIRELLPN